MNTTDLWFVIEVSESSWTLFCSSQCEGDAFAKSGLQKVKCDRWLLGVRKLVTGQRGWELELDVALTGDSGATRELGGRW